MKLQLVAPRISNSPGQITRRSAAGKMKCVFCLSVLGISALLAMLMATQGAALKTESSFLYDSFPPGFEWGVATSAYQVEGGASTDGRGPSIWDVYSHEPNNIHDNSNGDIACDSYHKFRTDVRMVKRLGMESYRFSLSWSRIMSDGTKATINKPGIKYYNKLINELLKYDIEPVVTLYHWDLPDAIQKKYGGWLGEKVVDLFGDYADLCFQSFGDRVKTWITINEPRVVATQGYESGDMAPGLTSQGVNAYNTSYKMLKAHARAYHIYHDKYKKSQNGKIAITLNCDWGQPLDESNPDDLAASDRYMQWYVGLYAHPIYHGDWPEVMKEKIAAKSAAEGLEKSRLPAFTQEEIDYIKGTNDFFGLNSYTTRLVTTSVSQKPGFMQDGDIDRQVSPDWKGSGSSWLNVVPAGILNVLKWLKKEYPMYGEIFITENGVSDITSNVTNICDPDRIYFFENYINNVLKAIKNEGVNVVGYFAWSLMDNFEWSHGYSQKFGIHYVDFNDPNRPRTQKSSAVFLKHLVHANGFPSWSIVKEWKAKARRYCTRKQNEMKTSLHGD